MKEGYEFKKKNTDYNDLENYVNGAIEAVKNYSTGLSTKRNQQLLKVAESLKADIIDISRLFSTEAGFRAILPYQLHNKTANKLVRDNIENLKKQQQIMHNRIKSNIIKLYQAPSTLGIKENKNTGEIETKTKEQLFFLDEYDKRDYGFSPYMYKGNFAKVDRELLDDMYDICEERANGDVQKAYSESRDHIETQEDKRVELAIKGNEYFFGRSFDSKGTVRDNPATVHILRELSEINEEKFCLGLEIPEEVYKNATPKELKMIEKYKKAINKKKEALAKIENQTMELVGPRRNKADIKMAIEHLSGDSKIPEETKQKLLKTLTAQLREEEKKEAKIQKQIDRQRRKGKIEQYDKSRYKLYSDMAKTQKDYSETSIEESNEKTYLQEDIARLTRALDNKSLSENARLDLEEQLTQKKKRLYSFADNSLNADERYSHKQKILSFWKYTVAKEVSPKKQQPLLLTEGVQKETVSARDKFVAELNFTPEETITTPTTEKDTIVKQNDSKDGIEPGDE